MYARESSLTDGVSACGYEYFRIAEVSLLYTVSPKCNLQDIAIYWLAYPRNRLFLIQNRNVILLRFHQELVVFCLHAIEISAVKDNYESNSYVVDRAKMVDRKRRNCIYEKLHPLIEDQHVSACFQLS